MLSTAPIEDTHKQTAVLIALHPSFMHRRYPLTADRIVLGRDAAQCDVVVTDATISRQHCAVEKRDGEYLLADLNSANGVFVNGTRIGSTASLQDGDRVGLGSNRKEHFRFHVDSRSASGWSKQLEAKSEWTIGRATQNDIALPFESVVSSLHATLRNRNGGLELLDNNSLNGTWVNGRQVKKARLRETDAITVGSTILRPELMPDGRLKLDVRECGEGIALECVDLRRTVGGGWFGQNSVPILEKITLSVRPGEFVGVLGPSGAGKSTLLKALNGYQRPDYGCVLLNDTPLYDSIDSCKTWLGYVPQDDIVHRELTVEQTLDYTARLRLPKDVTAEQRRELVDATLESLGLAHVRDSRVENLSGGQRKRVSIGCELLTRPSVLFLDEPTSGMDPSTEERLMRLFQDMTAHGTTILITTHILYNLSLLDRVIIMSRGRLVFFGAPREAMAFFSFDEKPLERPTRIFELLEGEITIPDLPPDKQGDKLAIADYFQERYIRSEYYRRNLETQISPLARSIGQQSVYSRSVPAPDSRNGKASGYRQLLEPTRFRAPKFSLKLVSPRILWTLIKRHFQVRLAFPKRLLFYMFVPIVLALVTGSLPAGTTLEDDVALEHQETIRSQIHDGPFDMGAPIKALLAPDGVDDPRAAEEIVYSLKYEGLPNLPTSISVLLMFVMMAIFTGTLVACLEISAERPIFVRERMANLKIAEYVGSKLPFLLLLTAGQCLVFLVICWFMIGEGHFDPLPTYLALVTMSWTACAMGLAVSAADPTPGQFSVILAIIVVLPQLVFSGGLGPDFYQGMNGVLRGLADATPARYGLEMLMTAAYDQPERTALEWLGPFVRDTIGFEFGSSVYQRNTLILGAQTLAWLFICGALLKYRKTGQ